MKLIVGLGNPGLQYAATRHNVGFLVLDQLADRLDTRFAKREHNCETAQAFHQGQKLLLAKPQSYMNLSGYPVLALCQYYKLEFDELLVICDDLALPPGQLRLRRGGSAGGHNGLKSIIEQTGTTAINRLKIGIGPALGSAPDYVLARFAAAEMPVMAEAFAEGAAAALCWAGEGIAVAMNQYNRKPVVEDEEAALGEG